MITIGYTYQTTPKGKQQGGKPSETGMLYLEGSEELI